MLAQATSLGDSAWPTWTTCRRELGQALASPRARTPEPDAHQTSSGRARRHRNRVDGFRHVDTAAREQPSAGPSTVCEYSRA